MNIEKLKLEINNTSKVISDFPTVGVQFRDLTPVFNTPHLLREISDWLIHDVVNSIQEKYEDQYGLLAIGGIESRGFILAASVASRRLLPLVLFRKSGKLPREVLTQTYQKEYGQDSISVHKDDLTQHKMILLIDDVLASGGTLNAANGLCAQAGVKSMNAVIYDLRMANKVVETYNLL